MTDSSCVNRRIRRRSGHRSHQNQGVMILQTIRVFHKTGTHAPGLGKGGHSRRAPYGGPGSTPLKAARPGQSAHQAQLSGGMAGDQAFSQAVSRAWHCSNPPGCLEMGAGPFGQPGLRCQGQRQTAVGDALYASLVPRAGLLTLGPWADVGGVCVYRRAHDSQPKNVNSHYSRKFELQILKPERTQHFLVHSPSDRELLH